MRNVWFTGWGLLKGRSWATFGLLTALLLASTAARAQQSEGQGMVQDCADPFADVERLAFDPSGWATNFCRHSVPYEEIRSGGPPRDGIPPIDQPQFVSVEAAGAWLDDREPVILLRHEDEARAYPLQILVWHEIVNDRIKGTPVAVTFCPLCYAAVAFRRPMIDGDTLTFGTSGNLRRSDLVMWDRQTESWWQQFTGEAIVGDLTGTQLELLPASIVAWDLFRERFPEGQVLSRETGYDRAYGRNPYAGYDDIDKSPFLYDGPVGEALPPMARVVGVTHDGQGRAYPLKTLQEQQVINDRLGDTPLVLFWQEGTASAVDRSTLAEGRDIGATHAFRRTLDERTLTFEPAGAGRFTDAETGSTWNVLGEALDGSLEGQHLEPLVHHDIFWFVWSAFQPEGDLYDPTGNF